MKNRLILSLILLVALITSSGCGRSREEIERERRRLEMEEQAQRDLKRANEVIGDMGKKIGRKPPGLDLGLPAEKKAEPAPAEPVRKP